MHRRDLLDVAVTSALNPRRAPPVTAAAPTWAPRVSVRGAAPVCDTTTAVPRTHLPERQVEPRHADNPRRPPPPPPTDLGHVVAAQSSDPLHKLRRQLDAIRARVQETTPAKHAPSSSVVLSPMTEPSATTHDVTTDSFTCGVSAELHRRLDRLEDALVAHQNTHIIGKASIQRDVDHCRARLDDADFRQTELTAAVDARVAALKDRLDSSLSTCALVANNAVSSIRNSVAARVREDATGSSVDTKADVEALQELLCQYEAHADAQFTSVQLSFDRNMLELGQQLKAVSYVAARRGGLTVTLSGRDERSPAYTDTSRKALAGGSSGGIADAHARFLSAVSHVRAALAEMRLQRADFERRFIERIAQITASEPVGYRRS